MLEERTVLVSPRANLTDAEQLAFADLFGVRINLTSRAVTERPDDEPVYQSRSIAGSTASTTL